MKYAGALDLDNEGKEGGTEVVLGIETEDKC